MVISGWMNTWMQPRFCEGAIVGWIATENGLEYTVDVQDEGYLDFGDMLVATGNGGMLSIGIRWRNNLVQASPSILPAAGIAGNCKSVSNIPLNEGESRF